MNIDELCISKGVCPLGLECPEYDDGICINAESCYNYAKAWTLYEILLIPNLPPLYVHVSAYEYNEWHKPEYGFKELIGFHSFVIWFSANIIDLEAWSRINNLLSCQRSRGFRGLFCREVDFLYLQSIRCDYDVKYSDIVYIKSDESDVPF